MANKYLEIMDTTLRDGEQMDGVSYTPAEKLDTAKMLLGKVGVDRIEVASALVSQGEKKAVRRIINWASKNGAAEKVEVLCLVSKASVDWAASCGCRTINLLAKGSVRHVEGQLGVTTDEHVKNVLETTEHAVSKNMSVNVYLEDWSQGIKESPAYVKRLVTALVKSRNVKRVLLPDTLGVLCPLEVKKLVGKMISWFPKTRFDFHGHNDYGMATANTLIAVRAGVSGVHATVNGLGERTGNAALDEVVVAVNDFAGRKTGVNEAYLKTVSRLVEAFSGKKIAENKPVTGRDVFTQTAGVHADGDKKAGLYKTPLKPSRFGRVRKYALGKLSGTASIEQNIEELGIGLSPEDKKKVLDRVVELSERKELVTAEDLPFIIADVLDTPEKQRVVIRDCTVTTSKGANPVAVVTVTKNGKTVTKSAHGNGGYNAFMNALRKAARHIDLAIAALDDYSVRIPPGGRTDAIVETTITWRVRRKSFRTRGVDPDQLMAAIKATEKMLNMIN